MTTNKRFDKPKVYGRIVIAAHETLMRKDGDIEFARTLHAMASAVLNLNRSSSTLKTSAATVDRVAATIPFNDRSTSEMAPEEQRKARDDTDYRQRLFELGDMLTWAGGGAQRRTCKCGVMTFDVADYPEGWALMSGHWRCPAHAPKRIVVTPEQQREHDRARKELAKLFGAR